MGLNISIQVPETYAEHPDWDSARYAGDREFWETFKEIEFDQREADGFPWEDDRVWYRPKDFPAFRSAATASESPKRWQHAADLLEASAVHWLYFGY